MNQGHKKTLEGVVVSDKMQKTIVVAVERILRHPRYEKQIKRTTKFHVHDEQEIGKVGLRVIIQPCRPLSKTKAWTLVKLLTH